MDNRISKKIDLTIATPLRTVYQSEVDQLTVTTSHGEITILPNHIPLVTTLKTGQAMVKKDGHEVYHAIDGGILEVRSDNTAVILSDRSENMHEIDIARAEEALARAKAFMERKQFDEDVDYARLERDIAKELNRIKISRRGERR